MIRKSDKLICAYFLLAGEKFDDDFNVCDLLFTAQELLDKTNEIFEDDIKTNIFQNLTIGRVDSHVEGFS